MMGTYQKSRRLYLLFELDVKERGVAPHLPKENKQPPVLATRRMYISSGYTRHDLLKGMEINSVVWRALPHGSLSF
jgi:hypothetical protein